MTKEEKKKLAAEEAAKKKELKAFRKKLRSGQLARREARAGLLFVTPWIIGALAFLAYPLITSLWYALNNIRITPLGKTFTFVGYGNWTQILLSDQDFLPDLMDYILSTVISTPIIVVFSLLIAMMLNQKIKGRGFFRMIFFLPVIIVSGPILETLNSQGAGSISSIDTQSISAAIGSFLPSMIAEPISDVFGNMVTILWYSGVQILLFISGLQKIDSSMYEAARIDGAGAWETFWKITLPSLKSMIMLTTVYTVVFISNNSDNAIIELIKSSMFSGIQEKGYGYASAMAWLYSIIVLLIVGIMVLLLMGSKDANERAAARSAKELKKEQKRVDRLLKKMARKQKRKEAKAAHA